MSTATTLIRASEVVNQGIVKGAPISNRFDASLFAPNVNVAEINYLKPLIDGDFFNDLIATRNNNDCNYNSANGPIVEAFPNNPNYERLWKEKLFPYLSRAVYIQSIGSIMLQTKSQGVEMYSSQFGESAGIKGWKLIEDKERNTIEILKEDLKIFLCAHKADYPLWDSNNFCSDCSENKTTSYNLGFTFYKTR